MFIFFISKILIFEKIIIKNGLQIMFFINNPLTGYYKSDTFGSILEKINEGKTDFVFVQKDGKLRIKARNVDSLSKALRNLERL